MTSDEITTHSGGGSNSNSSSEGGFHEIFGENSHDHDEEMFDYDSEGNVVES